MNIRLITLTTFLFGAYNCQASVGMHHFTRGEMIQASLNSPKLTIREQLEQRQEIIRATARRTEFGSKYPEFLLTPENYKKLNEQEKKDFQEILDRSMQIEFINRILGCMEQSNTAEKCFCKQLLEISDTLEDELATEDVYEEFRHIHLIGFKSAHEEVAQIIFNPENNQK